MGDMLSPTCKKEVGLFFRLLASYSYKHFGKKQISRFEDQGRGGS
jgi:hypothetical protein